LLLLDFETSLLLLLAILLNPLELEFGVISLRGGDLLLVVFNDGGVFILLPTGMSLGVDLLGVLRFSLLLLISSIISIPFGKQNPGIPGGNG
jgi:hypothetical protein